ncbi:MAG: M3 family metallopeptidase [Bacteroidales bacterium]|nr:M3 family metallopeptidase [Bacteroidales bacterium]MBQ3521613.1 M3 family metallopeptidase [Bacteroidales bacterium]MBQ8033705.1 M3 family metallopeptidase [Bacteroidales bacterium]MBR4095079.1 M3 family metallopeptidase [Bacteroidales bacterium]
MKRVSFILTALCVLFITSCNSSNMTNPLLEKSTHPYNAPAFDKIKTEHYLPAFKEAIAEGKQEIEAIVNNQQEPTFENTILALNYAGEKLNTVSALFFNINEANTNEQMQKTAEEISPLLTEYSMSITLNEKLFERVKAVYQQKESLNLGQEEARLLEQTYKQFANNGANLSPEDKEKFAKIQEELSLLSLKFGNNTLAATNAFILHITDSTQLAGLPAYAVSAGASEAKARNLEGWVFTLQHPSMSPFMQFSQNRELREKMWRASNTKCIGGEFDNQAIVKRIAELRIQEANLLGHKLYSDYALEERMAKNTETVNNFLNDLLEKSLPYAKKDVEAIQKYANQNGLEGKLMPWDFSYYSEKLKNEKYAINDELLKPYFKLENVQKAVFALADSLYGLKFTEAKDIPGYHPDVQVYDVTDANGKHMALFYSDFYPRDSKSGGAWMTEFRGQGFNKDGVEERPFISIVCNFTKPTETEPSLLTFYEVTTLLHEFGHALHGILAEGKYSGLTGTNVARDFVELPSQIMENWATQKEYLASFAKHYQTGEVIPDELIQKIIDSKNYNSGYASVRQLNFGITDMAWHTISEVPQEDVVTYEAKAIERAQIMPYIEGTAFSTSFGHIFSGGYAAGYYSYKWAEVLEADAFQVFKEKGIFNKEVAESFRKNILSRGNIEDADVLYRNFRGRDPRPEALMEKLGMSK